MLQVRPDAFLIGGAKISEDWITVTLTDFAGGELSHTFVPMDSSESRTARDVVSRLRSAVMEALEGCGRSEEDLASLGVGVPGFVDSLSGNVQWSVCFNDRDVRFSDLIEAQFTCPVALDNDANLVALAEKWFGHGRGVENFIVLTIEHGIGLGIILDGKIFRGVRGIGTEFGHTKIGLGGKQCRCGQFGCLEAHVADYALARDAGATLGRDLSHMVSYKAVLNLLHGEALAGNPAARAEFDRAGELFAVGLANLVNVFDPSLIIFSGEQMNQDYLFNQTVLNRMQSLTVVPERALPDIRIHKWGERIWARGAAALAMDALVEKAACGARRVAHDVVQRSVVMREGLAI